MRLKWRSLNPDVIICMPHWGDEYKLLPNKGQRDLADWLFDKGVDHIIGGHPHVVEPIEVRDTLGGKHLLAYSLGNFVSNQSRPNTYGGTMVRMTLTKKDGKTTLTDCGYNLYWVVSACILRDKITVCFRYVPPSLPEFQTLPECFLSYPHQAPHFL